MAYRVPEFPLTAAIFGAGFPVGGPPRAEAPCNVGLGRRVTPVGGATSGEVEDIVYQLLFPAGTDVRDNLTPTGGDFVVVPAGSGRQYFVVSVNDFGQGFPNEHRVAFAIKTGVWPAPLPPVYVPPA